MNGDLVINASPNFPTRKLVGAELVLKYVGCLYYLKWSIGGVSVLEKQTCSNYLERATAFIHCFLLGIQIPLCALAAEDYECLFWKPLAEISVFLTGD